MTHIHDVAACPVVYPEDMTIANNCGLVALSIVTGKPLTFTTEWFRVKQKARSNWTGSTKSIHYGEFLQHVGKWFVHTKFKPRERIRTLGDFAEWHTKPGAVYVVTVRGHAVAVKDGWIADQCHAAPAVHHPCRNQRVLACWQIL